MYTMSTTSINPAVHVEESEHRDIIFHTDGVINNTSIKEDKHYQNPTIKTWIYTNIDPRVSGKTIWVDIDGFPMPAEYNDDLYTINGNKKGTYIITRYQIPRTSTLTLESIIPILMSKLKHLHKSTIEALSVKFREKLIDVSRAGDIIFRLVYFVPYEKYNEHDVLLLGNIKTSFNIEAMYDDTIKSIKLETELTDVIDPDAHSLVISIDYSSPTNKEIEIPVAGRAIKLTNTVTTSSTDILNINVYGKNEQGKASHIMSTNILYKDFYQYGILNETASMDALYEEIIEKIFAADNVMYKAINDLRKYAMEHDISLHKLLAYEAKTDVAIKGIKKEEIALAREGLKTVASFI